MDESAHYERISRSKIANPVSLLYPIESAAHLMTADDFITATIGARAFLFGVALFWKLREVPAATAGANITLNWCIAQI